MLVCCLLAWRGMGVCTLEFMLNFRGGGGGDMARGLFVWSGDRIRL